jgi:ABC-type Mn2+/Zn2+ transport system ATPase subunit
MSASAVVSTMPAIRVRDVRLRRGGRDVLTIDDLTIPYGVTALVGSNGSGKSTLLHAIAGVLESTQGSITTDGDVAYVLQSQHASEHLLVTAGEVVALARSTARGAFGRLRVQDREAVRRAMERLDVADLAKRHLADMSGGQRQRVFVAQGLAQESPILLLDEPVAGLDIVSIDRIRRIIEEERTAGHAVVVATHDLAEAARADHVVLVNGRVISAGTPDVALTPEHLKAAYGSRVLDLGDGRIAIDDGVHHDDHEHHHHDH